MNVTPADIERIVREVLGRLAPTVRAAPAATNGSTALAPAGSLVLAGKVVTTADLDGRLDGVTTLLLAPRAVVTPAARDLLRQRGVTVASHLPAVTKSNKPSTPLVLGV